MLKAIDVFTRLASEYPKFDRGRDAAIYAVQIAAEVARDPANRNRSEMRKVFINALKTLIETYPDSQEARYWRFFLANMLELEGDFRGAAGEFAKVEAAHENYLDALVHRVNALAALCDNSTASAPADPEVRRREVNALAREATACSAVLCKSLDHVSDAQRRAELEQNAGDVLLTAARLTSAPPLNDYAGALKILQGFDDRYAAYRDLVGRSMRLRIVALQGLNQLDQARQLIPDYLKRDPENAGATLSALLTSMQQEVVRLRERRDAAGADKAAAEAVDLARWLYKWTQENSQRLKPDDLLGIRTQVAQALLEAGEYVQARDLFQQCHDEDAARSANKEASHGPTLMGLAESYYLIGRQEALDGQYDKSRQDLAVAQQRFMAVWRRAEPRTPLWWQALLRALEVPVELREVLVIQLERARRGRDLTADERHQLAEVPKTLDRVEQTINAERLASPDLGGHGAVFGSLLKRASDLRQRTERLIH
jgi:hypothetical protein